MTPLHDDLRTRAIRRFRWLGLILPLAVAVCMTIVLLVALPFLPDPAAVHWGLTGGPDGFGPAWTFPVMTLALGGGMTALIAGPTLAGIASPGKRISYRFMAAVIWFETALLSFALPATALMQIGLDDARDAPSATGPLIGGAVVGLLLAVVVWKLSIDVPGEGDAVVPDPVELSPAERAVWLRTVTMARPGLILLAGGVVLLVAMAVGIAVLDVATAGVVGPSAWITGGAALLVLVLVAVNAVFEVRVDDAGLTVRAPVGWPRIRIAREDIRAVEVVDVSPMGEFGGWGWRFGPSGQGIVMRAGEGLRITRASGKPFTVTVDDAATAAALLGGMRKRAGGAS